MAKPLAHPKGDLIRYLDGELQTEDKRKMEAHLASCTACQQRLSFMREFNDGLAELNAVQLSAQEPCPDAPTLVRYEAGDLDQETAEHLRAHMLFCTACRDDYYTLRRLSRQESWQALLERLKDTVIIFTRSYGRGALVGPVRIVAEQPAFAMRGREPSEAVSKVLEIQVGENIYSTELKGTEEELACDIGGFHTPVRAPLSVSVRSGSGEELISTQSDEFGNCHFVIPTGVAPDESYVFTLTLKDSEKQFLFRVREGKSPA